MACRATDDDPPRSAGTQLSPPDTAVAGALAFVASRAAAKEPLAVLLALSGRAALPAGYSVY